MKHHKTDITPIHHPHEYEVLSPTGRIYIGTKAQCEEQLAEISFHNFIYGSLCKVVKA